jgi:hypothetical protein
MKHAVPILFVHLEPKTIPMKIIELSTTRNRLGGRRYFADGRRISQDRYEQMTAMSAHTDCFCIRRRGLITRHFKTIRLP